MVVGRRCDQTELIAQRCVQFARDERAALIRIERVVSEATLNSDSSLAEAVVRLGGSGSGRGTNGFGDTTEMRDSGENAKRNSSLVALCVVDSGEYIPNIKGYFIVCSACYARVFGLGHVYCLDTWHIVYIIDSTTPTHKPHFHPN